MTYRRKLEPEDSSYDSDHEFLSSSRSSESAHTLHTYLRSSSSHDDISRSASETLGQEYAEYVTFKKSGSRDSSPTLSERLEGVRESPVLDRLESVSEDPGDVIDDIYSITHNPNYNTKVRNIFKMTVAYFQVALYTKMARFKMVHLKHLFQSFSNSFFVLSYVIIRVVKQ